MKSKIPPSPPLLKGGETRNLEPGTCNLLSGSLAWLDYCLGETAAAMSAVKAAALDAAPPGLAHVYHEMCEAAAGIITLKGRARQWMKPGFGFRVLGSGTKREGDLED